MPHKHTRRRTSTSNPSTHDLPPSTLALPLPVSKTSRPRLRPKTAKDNDDDTPRAFLRLLSNHAPPSGLDDGPIPPPPKTKNKTKKRKRDGVDDDDTSHARGKDTQQKENEKKEKEGVQSLQILPTEHPSDFSARVDRAFPLTAGLVVGKGEPRRQSRLERKMQRMQGEWTVAERERRRREVEALDQDQEDTEDGGVSGGGGGEKKRKKKKGKKGKGKKKGGESEDEDPWAVVRANRRKEEGRGLVGLHDVVEAPPRFERRVGGGAEGMKIGMGGLKRQVEMGEARREVVEGYRRMMAERREMKGVN
ncbi:MAG: hypothetical protein LQ344_003072 [Seirophora lacunosa]|nr:MAG: hypothetical protein LQ344_003072 [Seirophora lacunosa]